MMASIRTVFEDPQYVDQDFTPTFITASSFSVPGNQTSAVHIGRRLKCFDATAGVQQVIYGTVVSVSFTAVTTIHIEADAGSLTSSLSSFGISIIANTPNNCLPRNAVLTVSSLAVNGSMSISGSIAVTGLAVSGTATVSGNVFIGGTLSVSATAVAAQFNSGNTPKAWAQFLLTAAPTVVKSFNIASISRSAAGIFRATFSNALTDASYSYVMSLQGVRFATKLSATSTTFKFTAQNVNGSAVDDTNMCIVFFD